MEIHRIRYFVQVAREKNFSKAAKLCHISQPSLSQQIMKLESEVGGALFTRTRGRVELTEHGHGFMRHANAILAEVQTAEEFVLESEGKATETLRFGAIPTIAPYMMPGLFSRLKKDHPELRLELRENVTSVLVESLKSGEIDFALMSPETGMEHRTDDRLLRKDKLLLTLPQEHPLCEVGEIQVADLKKEQAILLEQAHCLSEQVASYCEVVGLGAHVTIRASQIDTLLGLVESGFGYTFTPEIAASHHRHRKVAYHEIGRKPYFREIRLYWMKRKILPRLQRKVIDSIESILDENNAV